MATPQQQQVIKQWLDRVLGPYPSSDIVSREALAALAKFPTLAVKTDAYSMYTIDSVTMAQKKLMQGLVSSLRLRPNKPPPPTPRHHPHNLPLGDLSYPPRNMVPPRVSTETSTGVCHADEGDGD